MKVSERLYAASDYIRKHGYSPKYRAAGNCGCFAHAIIACAAWTGDVNLPLGAIERVIGCSIHEDDLRDSGWKVGADKDAAAALLIAADIAAAEGN